MWFQKWIPTGLLFLCTGCATQFVYSGELTADCSDDQQRDHLVWWRTTERRFWFDEHDGAVRLEARCVSRKIAFDESEDGIYFVCGPNDVGSFETVGVGDPCGRVLTSNRVEKLGEGRLEIEIWCEHEDDGFGAPGTVHAYLAARETPYVFQISKSEASTYPGGAPRLECR